ncbi:PH domain-containing protein [Thalassiella azotivora]
MLGRAGRQQRLDTPRHIERYLLDEEQVVLAVRRHPVVVAEPIVTAVVGLLAVAVVGDALPRDLPYVVDVLWWGWFALVGRALWRLAEYHNDWFLGTDRRLILTYGIVTRKVAMMPLAKVTDLSYNRSVPGRLLGYGEFVLESAGQDQAMRSVNFLPSPDELYRRICGQIFLGSAQHRIPGTGTPVLVGPGPGVSRGPGGAGAMADAPPERPARRSTGEQLTEEVDVSDLRDDDAPDEPTTRRTVRRYTEHHDYDPGDD